MTGNRQQPSYKSGIREIIAVVIRFKHLACLVKELNFPFAPEGITAGLFIQGLSLLCLIKKEDTRANKYFLFIA